ncbi:MAG TPA: hypothetical protein VE685_08095 [Thermoanaerobaculia bacterium]|nr:hypothetical protein [Thermoanaerobaculia bacterium]
MAWGKKQSGGGGGVAWLALIVAILALILAWSAYRRTGGDLDSLVQDVSEDAGRRVRGAAEEGTDAVGRQAELAEARARLLGHRAEVEADRNLQKVREDVAEIREDLELSYRNAGEGAKARWRNVDAELERLEARLREGSARAVDSLDAAVEKIQGEEEQ